MPISKEPGPATKTSIPRISTACGATTCCVAQARSAPAATSSGKLCCLRMASWADISGLALNVFRRFRSARSELGATADNGQIKTTRRQNSRLPSLQNEPSARPDDRQQWVACDRSSPGASPSSIGFEVAATSRGPETETPTQSVGVL